MNTPCLFSNLVWFNAAIKTIWSYIYWKSRTRAYTFTAHLKDTQNDAWKALKGSNFDDRCYLFPIYWIKKRKKSSINMLMRSVCEFLRCHRNRLDFLSSLIFLWFQLTSGCDDEFRFIFSREKCFMS